MNISTDVHRVKSITARDGKISTGTFYTEFTLVTDDGEFTLTAFGKNPITIDGAEMVNLIAATSGEAA
jgi:hypothetical protein